MEPLQATASQCKHASSVTVARKKKVYSADTVGREIRPICQCDSPRDLPQVGQGPPFPQLFYFGYGQHWPASHADWIWIPLSLQPRKIAYLLFVSDTILFCKCAVATGQRSPLHETTLSLSPRYICTINKEREGYGAARVLTSSFIFA